MARGDIVERLSCHDLGSDHMTWCFLKSPYCVYASLYNAMCLDTPPPFSLYLL